MAQLTFTVNNDANTTVFTKTFNFPESDLPRLAAWARASYLNTDGSEPSNQVAWNRATKALAQGLLRNVETFEKHNAAKSAVEGVPEVGEPV